MRYSVHKELVCLHLMKADQTLPTQIQVVILDYKYNFNLSDNRKIKKFAAQLFQSLSAATLDTLISENFITS